MRRPSSKRAARYRQVPVGWVDDTRFDGLSGAAFRAYWAIRCGPCMGAAAGICRAGAGYLADTLRMPYGDAEAALRDLEAAGLIQADRAAGLVYFPGVIADVGPKTANALKSAWNELYSLTDSPLVDEAIAELSEAAGAAPDQSQSERNPGAAHAQPMRSPCATDADKDRRALGEQEQIAGAGGAHTAPARAAAAHEANLGSRLPGECALSGATAAQLEQAAEELLLKWGTTLAWWRGANRITGALEHSHLEAIRSGRCVLPARQAGHFAGVSR